MHLIKCTLSLTCTRTHGVDIALVFGVCIATNAASYMRVAAWGKTEAHSHVEGTEYLNAHVPCEANNNAALGPGLHWNSQHAWGAILTVFLSLAESTQ